jgi:hypothetical protein
MGAVDGRDAFEIRHFGLKQYLRLADRVDTGQGKAADGFHCPNTVDGRQERNRIDAVAYRPFGPNPFGCFDGTQYRAVHVEQKRIE